MQDRNARIGLVLFCIYLLLYGGFVFLSAFSPHTMEMRPVAGVNLAILYGFGLIVAALVLALIYGYLCRDTGDGDPTATENDSEGSSAEAAQ